LSDNFTDQLFFFIIIPVKRKRPIFNTALDFLRSIVKDPVWKERGRLPGIRELAGLAGCSHYIMWKAVGKAKEEGLITVQQGKRISVGSRRFGPTPEERRERARAALASAPSKWEKLRIKIERDIISGVFRSGNSLPSLKELKFRYKVSYVPLKKALQALEDKGILSHTMNTYAIVPRLKQQAATVLVYLAWGDDNGVFKFATPFDHELLSILENECAHINIQLEKIVYAFKGRRIYFIHKGKKYAELPGSLKQVFGFILRTACTLDAASAIIPSLTGFRRPVAVLDEMGSPSLAEMQQKYRTVQTFKHTISQEAGKQMGYYLANLGHRRIAYFSPWHKNIWSINRIRGLKEIFLSLGYEKAVQPFTMPNVYQMPFEEKETRLVNSLISIIRKQGRNWDSSFPPLPEVIKSMRPFIKTVSWHQYTALKMQPLFEKALADSSITAWVCSADEAALPAMDFLKRNKVKVPDDISLAGFDDIADAARNNLTTYNFNFSRLVHFMLSYIMNPSFLPGGKKRRPVDLEGRIVERGTTGRPGSGA
jgi:DNA-binding transcriptional regulator YhcF (GntR family)